MSTTTFGFDASSGFVDAAPSQFDKLQRQLLVEAVLDLSDDDLYSLLTQQAKRRLGLLQGFRMVLALERCEDRQAQRALAVRFIDEVWRTHGAAGIAPLQRLLRA